MTINRFILSIFLTTTCGLVYAECLSQADSENKCRFPSGDAWCTEHGNGNPYAYADSCLNESSNQDEIAESSAVSDTEITDFFGTLTKGKKYSYVEYYGAESGDTVIWYFNTNSSIGRKIMATCKNNGDCYGSGVARNVSKIPKEIPESTSGTSKIVSVSKVSRNPIQ